MKDFNFMPALSMKQPVIISTRAFISIIVLAVALAVAIIYPYYRTSVLEQQFISIQQQIERTGAANAVQKVLASKLEKQMAIIGEINKSNISYSEAEARLLSLIPDGVIVDNIDYSGADAQLSGTAPDIESIIKFMEALDASEYYINNTFDSIDGGQESGTYNFKISARIGEKK
ncbi:PilN domain-containing protein [Mahella sp.]|uniref:PilN domain-containing protein n=1 Tax=Mahella sp. TaxID=2798721 RepID=UPI0025B82F8C|nr:PilN domain-containing protein [Mahella sp.]MBZ4665935.1 Fimbrial assembly family protein [Mahella sp.]